MRAMILAAGRGERLRPLTDSTPKPLIEVGGQPLVFHHLDRLAEVGFSQVVINTAHLASRIHSAVGDGARWGIEVSYSNEPEGALETGGGIARALSLLGEDPFIVINGDVFTDFPLDSLRSFRGDYAHLVLVPVPSARASGDFALSGGQVSNQGDLMLTFSGISVYHPRFFHGCPSGRWSVVPLLRKTVDEHHVSGQLYEGAWFDAGTPESLKEIEAYLRS